MAAVAKGVRRSEAVIVANVAVRASANLRARGRGHLVRAGKSPAGGAVIKCSRVPCRGVMAGGAERAREARGDVVWNSAAQSCRAVPLVGVATEAGSVGGSQIVIVVDVAIGAGRGDMGTGERKSGGAVIEVGGAPASRGMAIRAVGKRESGAGG